MYVTTILSLNSHKMELWLMERLFGAKKDLVHLPPTVIGEMSPSPVATVTILFRVSYDPKVGSWLVLGSSQIQGSYLS